MITFFIISIIGFLLIKGWKWITARDYKEREFEMLKCKECGDPITVQDYRNPRNNQTCDYCRQTEKE